MINILFRFGETKPAWVIPTLNMSLNEPPFVLHIYFKAKRQQRGTVTEADQQNKDKQPATELNVSE